MIAANRHLLALIRMNPYRQVDAVAIAVRHADGDGEILLLDVSFFKLRRRAKWAASVFATMMTPLVSRSSRCTMPGRVGPPAALKFLK